MTCQLDQKSGARHNQSGQVFEDPASHGNTQVRFDYFDSRGRGPHVHVVNDSSRVTLPNGDPHIPMDTFDAWDTWYGPRR